MAHLIIHAANILTTNPINHFTVVCVFGQFIVSDVYVLVCDVNVNWQLENTFPMKKGKGAVTDVLEVLHLCNVFEVSAISLYPGTKPVKSLFRCH